ncbi:RNA 2',3'-cyclic phosphodiesterase [Nanoarchaeota archaeon]
MRLFIALHFDESIKEVQDQIQKENAGFTFPKDFHLTLKFLGETDKVDEIKKKLSEIEIDPFEVELSEIGVFPSPQSVRVVWVGVKDGSKILELQKKIEDSLLDFFPRDERFHPHVTLARVKFVKDKAKLKENLGNVKVGERKFKITDFYLYESKLTPDGPVYSVIDFRNL